MKEKVPSGGKKQQGFQQKFDEFEKRLDQLKDKFELGEGIAELRAKVDAVNKRVDDIWNGLRLWFIIISLVIGALNATGIVLANLIRLNNSRPLP